MPTWRTPTIYSSTNKNWTKKMSYDLKDEEQERKLFVGGLNKLSTDEEHLKEHFQEYGDIIDCNIILDQERQSRGFGFILFEDATSVDKIIAAKKGGTHFCIDDHHAVIKRAFPKNPNENAGNGVRSGGGSMYRKIFVGGLPSSAVEDDLRTYFARYGRVNEIELLRDRETGRSRGFAFVIFDEEDSVDKCLQHRFHEICKRGCEVKRAQTRSDLSMDEEPVGRRGPVEYGQKANSAGDADVRLPMEEVSRLIQQAFVMGQSLCRQPGLQAPTAASLLNGTASLTTQPANDIILKALLGQQAAPLAPVVAPPPATPDIAQLASLLQSGGIDTNALVSLLRKEPEPVKPNESQSSNNGPTIQDDASFDYRSY